jgi:putative alpha-1,2-mannosidase
MRGKLSDGTWREPFDPIKSSHRRDDYCEGNGWQYLWLVPQDPEGLIEMLVGDAPFAEKLDQLFTVESIKSEGASADIVSFDPHHPGLIGHEPESLLDAWVFAAGSGAIDGVWRHGAKVVSGGRHHAREAIARRYAAVLGDLCG